MDHGNINYISFGCKVDSLKYGVTFYQERHLKLLKLLGKWGFSYGLGKYGGQNSGV